jgi:hypothetical protein
MEDSKPTAPIGTGRRGRPRKALCLADGRTPLDPQTFAHIKAMQAAGHNSQHVAEALQLELSLVNKVFGAPHYRP